MKKKIPFCDDIWECVCCKKRLPRDKFFANKRASNGIMSRCKSCHNSSINKENRRNYMRNYAREYVKSEDVKSKKLEATLARGKVEKSRASDTTEKMKERRESYKEKYPGRSAALDRVRYRIKTGELVKPKACDQCGDKRMDISINIISWDNYGQKFNFLCRSCKQRRWAHVTAKRTQD